jgi:hypothetical protein
MAMSMSMFSATASATSALVSATAGATSSLAAATSSIAAGSGLASRVTVRAGSEAELRDWVAAMRSPVPRSGGAAGTGSGSQQ